MTPPISTPISATVTRSTLREERHPNAVTAPPVNRGSMTPRPWRGFWNGIGTADLMPFVKTGESANSRAETLEPWQHAAKRRRTVFVLLTLLSTALATGLFADMQPEYNNAWLEYSQIVLFALLSATRPVASAVLSKVSSTKTVRRRLAACCQGSNVSARLFADSPVLTNGIRTAVPTPFQKPRQGRGVIEPRLIGGAVTAFGWRSSRRVLRVTVAEMGVEIGVEIGGVMV